MSPDTAICARCRKELHDKNNRRYRYPFITCTQCGPRYSIINRLPYERQDTSMENFRCVKACNENIIMFLNGDFFPKPIRVTIAELKCVSGKMAFSFVI